MARLLTQAFLDSLEPRVARYEEADSKSAGLRIIVQPSGAKSWAFRYRLNGRQAKATLGGYPALSLKEARKAADLSRAEIAKGKDPATEKRNERAKAKAQAVADKAPLDIIDDVVEQFVGMYRRKVRPRTSREAERVLRHDVLPPKALGGRRLSSITKADVHRLLDRLVTAGRPVLANRLLAVLKLLGSWACERGLVETNVFATLRKQANETPRDRVLEDGELRALMLALDVEAYPYGPLVRLLLLLGSRRTEVASATWSEFDLDAKTWRLPAARSKNRREHALPLPEHAVEILRSLPRFAESDLLFTNDMTHPVRDFDAIKKRLDASMAKMLGRAPAPWVLHDIRRTLATNLQRLGVRLEVTEAVLGHVGGSRAGVVGIYQRHNWA
jgi:integrase